MQGWWGRGRENEGERESRGDREGGGRKRDGKPRKLAIKYVCMDAFTNSQARGKRAEFHSMRDETPGEGRGWRCEHVYSRVVASCFPEGQIYNFASLGKFAGNKRKIAAPRHPILDSRRRINVECAP